MTRILVTGASGLLGASMLYVGRTRCDIMACVHTHKLIESGYKVRMLDLRDASAADKLVAEFSPDWICHCAAMTDVDLCEREPQAAHEANVVTTRILADCAKRYNSNFLLISTDAVFDGRRGYYVEQDAANPLNFYANTKVQAEREVQQLLPGALVVRTNFYGWHIQQKQSLAEWVLTQLSSGASVAGWHDVFFTPLFVIDLAGMLFEMMAQSLSGVYHVGSTQRTSKYDFCQAVAGVWNLNPLKIKSISVKDSKVFAPRPPDTSLVCDKLCAAMGLRLPDLEEGLMSMKTFGERELDSLKALAA